MNPQLEGVREIEGTYPFDVSRSIQTFRLNRFLWLLHQPAERAAFLADEEAHYRTHNLTPEEAKLVRSRDWLGLIHYGVNFFVLEKIARVLKLSNLDLYAQMRGESLEAFLRTRRVPEAR